MSVASGTLASGPSLVLSGGQVIAGMRHLLQAGPKQPQETIFCHYMVLFIEREKNNNHTGQSALQGEPRPKQ